MRVRKLFLLFQLQSYTLPVPRAAVQRPSAHGLALPLAFLRIAADAGRHRTRCLAPPTWAGAPLGRFSQVVEQRVGQTRFSNTVLLLLFGKLVQSLPYPYNYTKSCRLSLAGSDARRYAFVQHAHTLYVHTQKHAYSTASLSLYVHARTRSVQGEDVYYRTDPLIW